MVKASNAPVHLIIRISVTHSFVSNWMKSRANITESKIQTKCNYESALSQRTTKKINYQFQTKNGIDSSHCSDI